MRCSGRVTLVAITEGQYAWQLGLFLILVFQLLRGEYAENHCLLEGCENAADALTQLLDPSVGQSVRTAVQDISVRLVSRTFHKPDVQRRFPFQCNRFFLMLR